MKVKRRWIIFILILVLLVVFNIQSLKWLSSNISNKYSGKTLNKDFKINIKSGNLSTDYDIFLAIKDAAEMDLNTLNVPIAVNVDTLSSSNMSVDEYSKKKAIKLIKKLKKMGVNVILEPYPWIANGSLYETEWLPNNIDEFFYNWKTKVLDVLVEDVLIPYDVEAFIVASNLNYMESYEKDWCNIIDSIRQKYNGLITYKTNWWSTSILDIKSFDNYNKKLNNKVFSKVDFISIAAYFELVDKNEEKTENLSNSILKTSAYNRQQNVRDEIKNISLKWDKPIFFGELGFPKREKAATEPWNPNPSPIESEEEQAKCFEAYGQVFEKEHYILGFSVFSIGEKGADKNYYPSNKTKEIIKQWYK